MDYSPWGPREWDTTESAHTQIHVHTHICVCAHTQIHVHTLYLVYRCLIKASKIIIDGSAFHAVN